MRFDVKVYLGTVLFCFLCRIPRIHRIPRKLKGEDLDFLQDTIYLAARVEEREN